MASKLERWKRISGNQNNESDPSNDDKLRLVEDLSRNPAVHVEKEPKGTSGIDSDSKNNTSIDTLGVESESIIIAPENKDVPEGQPSESTSSLPVSPTDQEEVSPPVADKPSRKSKSESIVQRVNNIIKHQVETKETKADRTNKTSIELELITLAKLELFNRAHGGRKKGEFIQNLLDEYFADMEKDPVWKKILNDDVDRLAESFKRKRR